MQSEQERWAFARDLIEIHSSEIGGFVARRLDAMLSCGDDRLRFWQDIAERIATLSGSVVGFLG
jgi:hypothetical protein